MRITDLRNRPWDAVERLKAGAFKVSQRLRRKEWHHHLIHCELEQSWGIGMDREPGMLQFMGTQSDRTEQTKTNLY